MLDGEFIKGLVAVVGADGPVPPWPHVARTIGVKDARVSIARGVHPGQGHSLSVMGRGQHAVDHTLVGFGALVGEEGVKLLDRGRESPEVEADPADEHLSAGFGSRLEVFAFEVGQHEVVDRIFRPGRFPGRRKLRLPRCYICPVALPGGTALDPGADFLDLFRRQLLVGVRGRHDFFFILRVDAQPGLVLGKVFLSEDPGDALLLVKAQPGLPVLLVGSVTEKTIGGEDGTNVAVEADLLRGRLVFRRQRQAKTGAGDCQQDWKAETEWPGGGFVQEPGVVHQRDISL